MRKAILVISVASSILLPFGYAADPVPAPKLAADEDIVTYTPAAVSAEPTALPAVAAPLPSPPPPAAPLVPLALPPKRLGDIVEWSGATPPAANAITKQPAVNEARNQPAANQPNTNEGPMTMRTAAEVIPEAARVSVRPSSAAISPSLASVPGRAVVLPGTKSYTSPDLTHFLWNNTPISIAFDELSRLRGVRIQYSGSRVFTVTGDFRAVGAIDTLQAVVNANALAVSQRDGTYYVSEQAPRSTEPTMALSMMFNKIYSVPFALKDRLAEGYEKIRSADSSLTPVSMSDGNRVFARVLTNSEGHARLEETLRAASEVRPAAVVSAAKSRPGVTKISRDEAARGKLLVERAMLQKKIEAASAKRDW